MLTRIRNGLAVRKAEVLMPLSKMKYSIAQLLEREGLVEKAEIMKSSFKTRHGSKFDELKVVLKYKDDGTPAITALKRVSKPGLRVYVKAQDIPRVRNNFGMAVLSTPRGIMSSREARKQKIGGELICEIY